jgi:flavin-dependent dehydrogenase
MTAWDVAVIGGGVAGSTAAALLARHGLRVILMEKGAFPRQKVCGEFLSPEGADVLSRLGVWPQLDAQHLRRINGFTLTAGRRQTRHRLPSPGWGVSRWLLDHELWEHAQRSGAVTRQRCPVVRVEGDFARGFSLTGQPFGLSSTVIQARAVLCAAGRQGQPGAQGRTPYHRGKLRFVGLKAHVQGMPLDRHVELHTIQHGYCGMVELTDDVTNLCCWVEAEALRRAGGSPRRFLDAALRENPHLGARLQSLERLGISWTTTSYTSGRTADPVVSDIWNIGDCAAMVAPLTGDGMGMGLRAAELAATMMLKVFRQESTWRLATAEYARRWHSEFLPRLRWGRGLETLILEPRLAGLACGALRWLPPLLPQLYRWTRRLAPAYSSAEEAPAQRPHSRRSLTAR